MSKKITVCLDGTWNTPESETNIIRLFDALPGQAEPLGGDQSDRQTKRHDQLIAYYDQGVGTAGWLDDKVGGNLGLGVSKNVRQAYEFIWQHWQPGDDVFIFGFSRGAFTARSLAGFIKLVGKLRALDDVEEAYLYYRIHEPDEDDNFYESWLKPQFEQTIPIRFLGVFDTVGSLGLPFQPKNDQTDARTDAGILTLLSSRLKGWLNDLADTARRPVKGFHDTSLSCIIEEAWHALAVDERRAFFEPTLWTQKPGKAVKIGETGETFQVLQKVGQVWFTGSHADCGGGVRYDDPDKRLSNLPLLWMAEKAADAGLTFQDGFLANLKQHGPGLATAPQLDSMNEKWEELHQKFDLQPTARPTNNKAREQAGQTKVETAEEIHPSVRQRLGKQIEIRTYISDTQFEPRQDTYNPSNVS